MGGWNISSVHFYDSVGKVIHFGNGNSEPVASGAIKVTMDGSGQLQDVGSTSPTFDYYLVADNDLMEAYLFNPSGWHVQTRSTRSGQILKTITYAAGKLTAITDAFNQTISISRPSLSLIVITSPSGQVTNLTVDSATGLVTSITDPINNHYDVTYTSSGLMETFTKPSGAVSTFTYDARGNLTRDEHSLGAFLQLWREGTLGIFNSNSTTNMSTAEGRQTSYFSNASSSGTGWTTIFPDGSTSSYQYLPEQFSLETTPEGRSLTNQFSPDSRFGIQAPKITQWTIDSGNQSLTGISNLGTVFQTTDLLSLTSENETTEIDGQNWLRQYDGASKTETLTSPMGRVTSTQYNSHNQITSYKAHKFDPIEYEYDSAGRIHKIKQCDRATTFNYGTDGYVSSMTNSLNQTAHFTRDAHGRVLTQILPDTRTLQFQYDNNGNLSSITTASNILHSLISNLYDLLASYIAPSLNSVNYVSNYEYNNDRQLMRVVRPDNTEVNFLYGSTTGLLDQILAPEGSYDYGYHVGQLSNATAPGNVVNTIGYQGDIVFSFGLTWDNVNAGVSYGYSKFLKKSETITDSSSATSSIALKYDNDRLLTEVGDMIISRDVDAGMVSATALDNVSETFKYSVNYGEPAAYQVKVSGTEMYKELYTRDLLGRINRKVVADLGANTTYDYVYDPAGRLTQVWTNGSLARTYNYDNNSNRISVVSGANTINATYDAQDRLLTYGNYSFTYNARGELSGRTEAGSDETFSYSYNSMGALAAVAHTWNNGGTLVTDNFSYRNDAFGRGIEVVKNGLIQSRYLYNENGSLVAELDANGNLVSHFIYGKMRHSPDFMIRSGVTYKFVADQIGSVIKVVNTSTGAIASSFSYDEFGRVLSSTSPDFQPFGFAGGIRDGVTVFVRFGARDYDPETGRWTSKDPILFGGGDTNLYGYVIQDPVNFFDMTGKNPIAVGGALIAACMANPLCRFGASRLIQWPFRYEPDPTADQPPRPMNNNCNPLYASCEPPQPPPRCH